MVILIYRVCFLYYMQPHIKLVLTRFSVPMILTPQVLQLKATTID
jgi:hypothetical protein